MDGWIDRMAGWMDGMMDAKNDGWMFGWTDEDGCKRITTDGWMDEDG